MLRRPLRIHQTANANFTSNITKAIFKIIGLSAIGSVIFITNHLMTIPRIEYHNVSIMEPQSVVNDNEIVPEIVNKTRSNLRSAYMSYTDDFRLGGGSFINQGVRIIKQQFSGIYKIDFEDISSLGENGTLYDPPFFCGCTAHLGWITEWQSDIILWPNSNKLKDNKQAIQLLSNYDVLILYTEDIKLFEYLPLIEGQTRFWEPREPEDFKFLRKFNGKNTKNYIDFMQSKHIHPVILDNYFVNKYDLPNIDFHYKYTVKWMRDIAARNDVNTINDNKVMIYVGDRCREKDKLYEYIQSQSKTKFVILKANWTWDNVDYTTFYSKLSTTKYVINLDKSTSAGQIIAESAIFGIPVFGYNTKYLQQLLMPSYLTVNNMEQVIEKLKVLEGNNYLYQKIKLDILENADLYLSVNKDSNSLQKLIANANKLIN